MQARLDDAQPDFAVNNTFDVQTADVVIGAGGSAILPTGTFDYNTTASGVSFTGDNVQPISFTAAVITPVTDNNPDVLAGDEQVAEGPVSAPVYLTNPTETPVVQDGAPPVENGYFEGVGSGSSFRFKIQVEDPNGGPNGGTDPGGQWTFIQEGDAADIISNDSQGEGYYLWGSTDSTAINGVQQSSVLQYRIFIPDDEVGTYQIRMRVAREGNAASDQQNDIWLNLVQESTGAEIESFLTAGDEPEPVSQGYIKVFGGPNNGSFGAATNFDGLPGNPPVNLQILEGGFYTIELAGRSQGYFIDFVEMYKLGNTPNINASDSSFFVEVPTDPLPPVLDQAIPDSEVGLGGVFNVSSFFSDPNNDSLFFTAAGLPTGLTIDSSTGVISVPAGASPGTSTVTVTASDLISGSVSDVFELTISESVAANFTATAGTADDTEVGQSVQSPDLETDKTVVVRLEVPAGVSGVTSVGSALVSFQSERPQSGSSSLTFGVKNTTDAAAFDAQLAGVLGQTSISIGDAWADNQQINDVVDIADAVNALIANQGPLNAGDFINLVIAGEGATRFIVQGSVELDVSASGTGGTDNTAPVLVGDGMPATVNLAIGDPAQTFDLDTLFTDIDGDDLTYSLSGNPTGVEIQGGSTLVVDPTVPVQTPITVTASDGELTVSDVFQLNATSSTGGGANFTATAGAADDIEIGSNVQSSDLETDKTVVVRLEVPAGIAGVTSVGSALVSFQSERAQSGASTLTFGVKDTTDEVAFTAELGGVLGQTSTTIGDAWADNQQINGVVDIAGAINTLIANQGPLNAGDLINLVITGEGATRYIVQGSVELDVSASGTGGGGGDNTAPTLVGGGLPNAVNLTIGDPAQTFDLDALFTDLDGDNLTYSLSGNPAGVAIQGGSTLVVDPAAPVQAPITVTASDGELTVSDVFQLNATASTGGGDSFTLEKSIVSGSDDTDQDDGGVIGPVGETTNLMKSDVEIGDNGRDAGLRFVDLDLASIANGGIITNAYIELTTRDAGGNQGAANFTVSLENSLDGDTFSLGEDLGDRQLFSQSTTWSQSTIPSPNETLQIDGLEGMLQSFIDTNGLVESSSDTFVFVIEDNAGVRKVDSFEGSPTSAAKLVIEYELPEVTIDSSLATMAFPGDDELL